MLTKLRALYGASLRIVFKMGGLVPDIRQFQDTANGISGVTWYRQVSAHWDDASARHGMPVDSRVWYDVKDSFRSTYPANIAFKAAELLAPALASRFLRRLREAAAAERKPIHELDVVCDLAKGVGIDPEGLRRLIANGEAEHAFTADRAECRQRMIRSFPTFVLRNWQDHETVIAGYQAFSAFDYAVRALGADRLGSARPLSIDNDMMEVVALNGSTTTREVAEVFDTTSAKAQDALDSLDRQRVLRKTIAGNGYLYRAVLSRTGAACEGLMC